MERELNQTLQVCYRVPSWSPRESMSSECMRRRAPLRGRQRETQGLASQRLPVEAESSSTRRKGGTSIATDQPSERHRAGPTSSPPPLPAQPGLLGRLRPLVLLLLPQPTFLPPRSRSPHHRPAVAALAEAGSTTTSRPARTPGTLATPPAGVLLQVEEADQVAARLGEAAAAVGATQAAVVVAVAVVVAGTTESRQLKDIRSLPSSAHPRIETATFLLRAVGTGRRVIPLGAGPASFAAPRRGGDRL